MAINCTCNTPGLFLCLEQAYSLPCVRCWMHHEEGQNCKKADRKALTANLIRVK